MDPKVISAAASSPLGILALLILVLSGIATASFRQAPTKALSKQWKVAALIRAPSDYGGQQEALA